MNYLLFYLIGYYLERERGGVLGVGGCLKLDAQGQKSGRILDVAGQER